MDGLEADEAPSELIVDEQDAKDEQPASVMRAEFNTNFRTQQLKLAAAQRDYSTADGYVMTSHANIMRSWVQVRQHQRNHGLMKPMFEEASRLQVNRLPSYLSRSEEQIKEVEDCLEAATGAFVRDQQEWKTALDKLELEKKRVRDTASRYRSWQKYLERFVDRQL